MLHPGQIQRGYFPSSSTFEKQNLLLANLNFPHKKNLNAAMSPDKISSCVLCLADVALKLVPLAVNTCLLDGLNLVYFLRARTNSFRSYFPHHKDDREMYRITGYHPPFSVTSVVQGELKYRLVS